MFILFLFLMLVLGIVVGLKRKKAFPTVSLVAAVALFLCAVLTETESMGEICFAGAFLFASYFVGGLLGYFIHAPSEEDVYLKSDFYERFKIPYRELLNDPGEHGEYEVYKQLKRLPGEKKFLFSLETPDGKNPYGQETDLVMFWNDCLYIIEAKNWSGDVKINYNSNYWERPNNEADSVPRSPEAQNHEHELSIMKYLAENGLYPKWSSCVLFTDSVNFNSQDSPYDVKYNNIGEWVTTARKFVSKQAEIDAHPLSDTVLKCYDVLSALQKRSKEEIEQGKEQQRMEAVVEGSEKHGRTYFVGDGHLYRTSGLYWETLVDKGGNKLEDNNWRWVLSSEPSRKKRLEKDNSKVKNNVINDEVNRAYIKLKLGKSLEKDV